MLQHRTYLIIPPGGLSVYTTGDVAEYRLRAGQVGLERIDRVEWYPPMEL